MDTVKKVLDNRRNQVEQGEEQFLYTLTGMYNFSLFLDDTIVLISLSLAISLLISVGTGLLLSFLPSSSPPPSALPSSLSPFSSSLPPPPFLFLSIHIVSDSAFSLYTAPDEEKWWEAEEAQRKRERSQHHRPPSVSFGGLRCLLECSINPVILVAEETN